MQRSIKMHIVMLFVWISVLLRSANSSSGVPPATQKAKMWEFDDAEKLRAPKLWHDDAQSTLRLKLKQSRQNRNIAKNVIFFIGDGMSVPTVTAARIYDGQRRGVIGERNRLSFEKFPYSGLAKTYCVNKQVADSACTASAYLCGIKANYYTIGVTANVTLNDCHAERNTVNHLRSIAGWALDAGKSAGIVTTTRVTHASPAGAYAHTAQREFESDYDIQQLANITHTTGGACVDIARQLIENEVSQKFSVIFGGGLSKFLPNSQQVDKAGNRGERLDGRNLVEEWLALKSAKAAKFISDRTQLLNMNIEETDYALGLFAPSHLDYHMDNANAENPQPSLAEMTEAAIRILSKNPKGYFLFVEGGRIDHAHHETKARKALDETVQFAQAIETAQNLTDASETLLVVSADHGHTMTINGYPTINNDIVGLQSSDNINGDSLPYSTLSYSNGPGFKNFYRISTEEVQRVDLSEMYKGADNDLVYPAGMFMVDETHGGGDVTVYAKGCWEHLFTGVMEQNTLPHLMGFAACIGPGLHACKPNV